MQPIATPFGAFGTRSQTVLVVWRNGRAELRERDLTQDGSWQQVRHCFQLQLGSPEAQPRQQAGCNTHQSQAQQQQKQPQPTTTG
jgi:uncharacterized protein with NRDE domain